MFHYHTCLFLTASRHTHVHTQPQPKPVNRTISDTRGYFTVNLRVANFQPEITVPSTCRFPVTATSNTLLAPLS